MLRACGYTRVSSDPQISESLSLETQAADIRRRCASEGWDLVAVHSDPGLTAWGERSRKRPGLHRVLAAIRNREVEVVVFSDQSRLARDAGYVLEVIRSARQHGVRPVPLTYDIDYSSPEGSLQATLLAGLHEYFSADLSRKIKRKRREKAEAGQWVGRAPLGYFARDKKLLVDRRTAPLVREMFRRYIRRESLIEIAHWLTLATGRQWRPTDIRKRVASPTYLGLVPLNGQTYPGEHEGIVPRDLWDQAQATVRPRLFGSRNRNSGYMLSGLLRCRHCGSRMCGHSHGRDRGSSYECLRHKANRTCRGSYVGAARAHRLFTEFVRALSERYNPAASPIEFTERPEEAQVMDMLRLRLERIPERLRRTLRLYQDGLLTKDEYAEAKRELQEEQAELGRMSAEAGQRDGKPPGRDGRRYFRRLAEILDSEEIPMQAKKDELRAQVERAIIHPSGLVEVSFYRPTA